MAFKQFEIAEDISVKIYKRRTNRSLRLSLASDGSIKVTIPSWAPYAAGVQFAKSKLDWIREQSITPKQLVGGQAIGKAHHLEFQTSMSGDTVKTRIKDSSIIVTMPQGVTYDTEMAQAAAKKASIRALKLQADALLPQRLEVLSQRYNLDYKTVSVKKLTRRWGSCDQDQNIVLNIFLIQLPWELIDYVIAHELTHTEVMRHGPDFWGAMAGIMPDVKDRKKLMKAYQPVLR